MYYALKETKTKRTCNTRAYHKPFCQLSGVDIANMNLEIFMFSDLAVRLISTRNRKFYASLFVSQDCEKEFH